MAGVRPNLKEVMLVLTWCVHHIPLVGNVFSWTISSNAHLPLQWCIPNVGKPKLFILEYWKIKINWTHWTRHVQMSTIIGKGNVSNQCVVRQYHLKRFRWIADFNQLKFHLKFICFIYLLDRFFNERRKQITINSVKFTRTATYFVLFQTAHR